ncbi:MAG: ATP-dependent DNA ligase [Thermoplasmata archaeon]|nr:MAG: ATP-dependent DNA ligase [Thermoplasmata archaeon]
MPTPFKIIADIYEKLEKVSGRIEMRSLLTALFSKIPEDDIYEAVHLTLGQLGPDFMGLEFGVAEKLTLRAISLATGIDERTLMSKLIESGDIGKVAEWALSKKKQMALFVEELTVDNVYKNFKKMTELSGQGAMELRVKLLAELFQKASPKEGKYIARIATGTMRLGVAEATVLEAIAASIGALHKKDLIEKKYNIYPDLGEIARILKREGVAGVEKIRITLGVPVRPMLGERAKDPREIIERHGVSLVEYKYDGLRMQIHIKKDGFIRIFSRSLEDLTSQFPDVVKFVRESFRGEEAIVEGETVAIDPDTLEFRPFQEVAHRRGRKYDIQEAIEKYPVATYLFDCIYANGEDLTDKKLLDRRKVLESLFDWNASDRIFISEAKLIDNVKDLEEFFLKAIEDGCEGVMAKDPESPYKAGVREWLWIKYKRDYKSELTDTLDLVAVGAFAGKGKRAGTYGALLMATFNPEENTFETVCKLGTGFDDRTLQKLPEIFRPYLRQGKHPLVKSNIEADYWFDPVVVLEVQGAEITLSPVHTCARDRVKPGYGLAIRFPRFTGRWRRDKKPEDATTSDEVLEMYKKQLRKVGE